MSKHLQTDLQHLERHLLRLGADVEEAVRKSIAALVERREDLATEVRQGDVAIDAREVEIEEECLKVLALHQPVAGDLRFVAACLKINNDLERIGDLAVNIAERAKELCTEALVHVPANLREMSERVTMMLRSSLDAFVRGNAAGARAVLAADDEVDRLHRDNLDKLLQRMREDSDLIDRSERLISISRNLERIADHATNIAEDVVYLVDGDIIRHRPPGRIAPTRVASQGL